MNLIVWHTKAKSVLQFFAHAINNCLLNCVKNVLRNLNKDKQSRNFNRHLLSDGFNNDSYYMAYYYTDCVNILSISN